MWWQWLIVGFVTSQLISFLISLLTVRKRAPKSVELLKKEWKRDVVYVFVFPHPDFTVNLSPYCTKLLAYLRHHNIEHEVIETMWKRSTKGKMPFVELNGEQLADSDFIIGELGRHFSIQETLSEKDAEISRAVSRMVDQGTFFFVLYNKLATRPEKFAEFLLMDMENKALKWLLKWPLTVTIYKKLWSDLNGVGIGCFSQHDIEKVLHADLQTVNRILGNKEWIVGDAPSTADFSVFGHVAGCYNLPYHHPMQDMLDTDFPRLKAHHSRMIDKYFPDFNFARHKKLLNE